MICVLLYRADNSDAGLTLVWLQLSDSIDAHHQTNDVMRSAVASLIVAQDVGDYHGLTLKEFAGVLVVLDAASYLCRNVLLSAKVMLARKEILASEVEERLLTCPDHEAEYRDELRVNYVQQQESLSKVTRQQCFSGLLHVKST